MIHWIRHAANYEMRPPSPGFPIAIWIGGSQDQPDRFTYNMSIYAGTKLVKSKTYQDFEAAESGAIAWLENVHDQITELLTPR